MAKASELNPRFYQELIDRIKNGQPYEDMFDKHDPFAIRNILEEAQAEYTRGKHPFDLYEKPELFKNVPITEVPNLQDEGMAKFFRDKRTKQALVDEPMSIILKDKRDMGTLGHEAQHIYDMKSRPELAQFDELPDRNILSNMKKELEINRPLKTGLDLRGIEEAEQYLKGHFKPDVEPGKFDKIKQMLNLERVVSGKALKTIAPLVKAAGVGALGYQALGIGNKATAGDYGAAGMDAVDLATDLAPGIGEVKDAIRPTELANSELPQEEMEKRKQFNMLRQKLGK